MSSQKIKKPKICKCGHLKRTHMKKPNSVLKLTGNCLNCPCTIYQNRNRPFKSDKALAIILPIFFFVFVGLSIILYFEFQNMTEEEKNINAGITQGTFLTLMFLVILLAMLFLSSICLEQPILDYRGFKNRRNYPIAEPTPDQ